MELKYIAVIWILTTSVTESFGSLSTFLNSNHLKHNSTKEIVMFEEETQVYEFKCDVNGSVFLPDNVTFQVETMNKFVGAVLVGNDSIPTARGMFSCNNNTAFIWVKGGHLGITSLVIDLPSEFNYNVTGIEPLPLSIPIKILRKITLFDELAVFILGPLVLVNKCAFGAKIELDVLRRVVTKPMELALCLFTQFVIMPLLAVFLGYMCSLTQEMALALLVCAACPGGGGGYVYSYLINGDITLAITASLMSTLFAMIAMPSVIGIYVLGAGIPNNIQIPYLDILLMLMAIATPISCGMYIRRKCPHWAEKFIKIIRPLSLFLIAGGLSIVVVTSRYVFYGPRIGFLLAFLVPVSIFLIAIGLARCFKISWPLSKAVSLESGLKNTILGVAVIELSFPQPEADLASILIIMITVGQTLAGLIWYFFYLIKLKCIKQPVKHSFTTDTIDSEETTRFLGEE